MDTADRIIEDILSVMGGGTADPTPAREAIDYLTFRTYRHNRESGMSAEDLAKLFPQTGAAMEQRYWDEISAYADKMIRLDKEARQSGRPEHDFDVFGRPLRPGS